MATTAEKIINLMKYTYGTGKNPNASSAASVAGLARIKYGTNYGANTALDKNWTPDSESDWEDVRKVAEEWAASTDPETLQRGKTLLSFVPAKSATQQINEAGEAAGKTFDTGLNAQKATIEGNTGIIDKYSEQAATNEAIGLQGEKTAWDLNKVALNNQMSDVNNAWDTQNQQLGNVLYGQVAGQKAQQESVINGPGIWGQIKDIADKQLNDSVADLERIASIARANVEQSRVALNEQEKADFEGVIQGIEEGVAASRRRTREDMNARGMFFATLLDGAMAKVEAQGNKDTAQARAQHKARLAKIASDMAIMSGNIDIEMIKGNATATAQYTATMLQYVARDAETKQAAQAVLAGLNAQYGTTEEEMRGNIADIAATQTFSARRAELAPYQQSLLEGNMAMNTAEATLPYKQNLARGKFDQMRMQNESELNELVNMAPVQREQAIAAAKAAAQNAIAEAEQQGFENNLELQKIEIDLRKVGVDEATFAALYGKNGIKAQELAIDRARLAIDEAYKNGQLANGAEANRIARDRLNAQIAGLIGGSSSGSKTTKQVSSISGMDRDQILQELNNPVVPQSTKEGLMLEYLSLNPNLSSTQFRNFLFGVPSGTDGVSVGTNGLMAIDDYTAAIPYINNMTSDIRRLEASIMFSKKQGGTFADTYQRLLANVDPPGSVTIDEEKQVVKDFLSLVGLSYDSSVSPLKNAERVDTKNWELAMNNFKGGVQNTQQVAPATGKAAEVQNLIKSRKATPAMANYRVYGEAGLKNVSYDEVVAFYESQGLTNSSAVYKAKIIKGLAKPGASNKNGSD